MHTYIDGKKLREKLLEIISFFAKEDSEEKRNDLKNQALEILNNKDFRAHIEGKTSEQSHTNSTYEKYWETTIKVIDKEMLLSGSLLLVLRNQFCTKVDTEHLINDEFTDWREKINPFCAVISSYYDEDYCIQVIDFYLKMKKLEKRATSAFPALTIDVLIELLRCRNLENAINHKIQDNLINEAWNDFVKPYVGYTALHLAVYKGFSEVVNILLKEEDIDPNIKNDQGLTPLGLALKLDQPNSVKIIKALLNDPKVENNQNELPLLLIENCSIDLIDAFLEDSNTEQSTKDEILSELYKNPKLLFYVIQKRNFNITDKFLKNNDQGLTLLELALNSIDDNSYDATQLMTITGIAYKLALDPRVEFSKEQKTKLINAHTKIKYQLIKPIAQLLLFPLLFMSCSCICIAYIPTANPTAAALVITSSVIFAVVSLITFAMIYPSLQETVSLICTINGANKDLEKSYQEKQNQLDQNDLNAKTTNIQDSMAVEQHLKGNKTLNANSANNSLLASTQ